MGKNNFNQFYFSSVIRGTIGKTLHNDLFDKQNMMIRFDAVVDAVMCTLLTHTRYLARSAQQENYY